MASVNVMIYSTDSLTTLSHGALKKLRVKCPDLDELKLADAVAEAIESGQVHDLEVQEK